MEFAYLKGVWGTATYGLQEADSGMQIPLVVMASDATPDLGAP